MPHLLAVVILIALTLIILALMRRGWRNREKAITISHLPPLPPGPTPNEPGVTGVYVSTTLAGQPLERVVTKGLGVKSPVRVFIRDDGVLLERRGATSLFIPLAHLHHLGTTAGMIGKFAAPNSIVVLTWLAGDTVVDTGVHIRNETERKTMIDRITQLLDSRGETAS